MPKLKARKSTVYIDRARGRDKIESVRTHSEVIEQFDSFLQLKLLFLLETGIACHERLIMTAQSREKTAKTAVFLYLWHEKLYGR